MSKQQLVIGLGTGRSGTVSLSKFLNTHEGIRMFHEGIINKTRRKTFKWQGEDNDVVSWIRLLKSEFPDAMVLGDVGFYYLQYVDSLVEAFPDVQFIVMERNKAEVVESFMKKTRGRNHWKNHNGLWWRKNPEWDKSFPKYRLLSKRKAVAKYWDEYNTTVSSLMTKYPNRFLLVRLEDFNSAGTRNAILDFLRFEGERHIASPIKANASDSTVHFRINRLQRNARKLKRSLKKKLRGTFSFKI